MSLKRTTETALEPITESLVKKEQERSQFLFDLMRDIGVMSMTTNELEEWTYLMSKSLQGKGDVTVQ
jgi:hypothetical protein